MVSGPLIEIRNRDRFHVSSEPLFELVERFSRRIPQTSDLPLAPDTSSTAASKTSRELSDVAPGAVAFDKRNNGWWEFELSSHELNRLSSADGLPLYDDLFMSFCGL